jgi:hypothetical protein
MFIFYFHFVSRRFEFKSFIYLLIHFFKILGIPVSLSFFFFNLIVGHGPRELSFINCMRAESTFFKKKKKNYSVVEQLYFSF